MTNAELIKQIRHTNNLNTRQLGEKLGVTGRTVEAWEQGLRQPSKSAKILIEHIFKITL